MNDKIHTVVIIYKSRRITLNRTYKIVHQPTALNLELQTPVQQHI